MSSSGIINFISWCFTFTHCQENDNDSTQNLIDYDDNIPTAYPINGSNTWFDIKYVEKYYRESKEKCRGNNSSNNNNNNNKQVFYLQPQNPTTTISTNKNNYIITTNYVNEDIQNGYGFFVTLD